MLDIYCAFNCHVFIQYVRCLKIVILGFPLGISAQGFVPLAVHTSTAQSSDFTPFWRVLQAKKGTETSPGFSSQKHIHHGKQSTAVHLCCCPRKTCHTPKHRQSKVQSPISKEELHFLNYSRGTILEGRAAGQSYCKSSLVLPALACLHGGAYTRTDIPFSRDNDSQALTDKVRQQEVCSASENSETAGSAWMNPLITPKAAVTSIKAKVLASTVLYYLLEREHISNHKGARN